MTRTEPKKSTSSRNQGVTKTGETDAETKLDLLVAGKWHRDVQSVHLCWHSL